ncbi:MAG TPA: type II toxin-antitoxin system CcdA family antitoxin [Burkholderiaceae bacterium]
MSDRRKPLKYAQPPFPPLQAREPRPPRRATNLTLDAELVAQARALGVNVSQAAEAGLAEAVARRRAERWLAENDAALASSNAFVDSQGLPLAAHRNF